MATLKINGDTSGYVELVSPAVAGSTSIALDKILVADSSGNINVAGNLGVTGTVDGVDIAARDAILTSTTTTAGAALPKAGGTMTGRPVLNYQNPEIRFDDSDTSNNGEITLDNASLRIESDPDDAVADSTIKFNVDNDTKMIVLSSGNVGIGETSTAKLGNSLGTLLNVNNANIIGNGTSGAYLTYNARYNSTWLRQETSGVGVLSFTNAGNLTYRTSASGTAGTEPSLTEIIATGESDPAFVAFTGASQVRLTLGNEGTPGTNTANWIRGNAGYLQYNSASNAHTWEVGGTERMRLSPSGHVTMPNQPSFNAQRTSNQGIQGGTTLIFDQARHNTGNHYNTSTGVFTAPVTGDYLFTFKALFYAFASSEYLDLYSIINGTTRNRYEQTGNNGQHTQVDYTEVVRLNANDNFNFFANNRDSSVTHYSMYGNENHFSGYLLG